jgi:hypothetical protein
MRCPHSAARFSSETEGKSRFILGSLEQLQEQAMNHLFAFIIERHIMMSRLLFTYRHYLVRLRW